MKEILVQYASYNLWGNQLLLDLICNLTEEQQQHPVASSFNSLHKTVLHMFSAESVWWQRMKLQERINVPAETFTGDFKELSTQFLNQDRQWVEWVGNAQEHMLQHVFHYQNFKKEQFKQPIFQMMMHVFNHGTYHRGQLVTMLRQLGREKIPSTDFIEWSRRK